MDFQNLMSVMRRVEISDHISALKKTLPFTAPRTNKIQFSLDFSLLIIYFFSSPVEDEILLFKASCRARAMISQKSCRLQV